MKKGIIRSIASLLLVSAMFAMTACNNVIKVEYDYEVDDYVQLGDYKNIAVTIDKTSIEKQLVEDAIQQGLEDNTTYSEVSRGAIEGDQILVTYTGAASGITLSGFSDTEGVTMILGTDTLGLDIDELEEALYGMAEGETKVLVITLPDDYDSSYAGTTIVFELSMQTVAQPYVPMLTDAYAQEYYGYDTMEEYREYVRESVASDLETEVEDAIQEQVLTALQDICTVNECPQSLLDETTTRLDESVGFYADYTSLSKDEYCQQLYGLSYDEFVEKTAKQQLIMEAIVKNEGLELREYEYKGDLDDFAADNGYSSEDTFVEKFGKDTIVKAMLVQQAQELVIDSAQVTYN